jgi:hypothetical protein
MESSLRCRRVSRFGVSVGRNELAAPPMTTLGGATLPAHAGLADPLAGKAECNG